MANGILRITNRIMTYYISSTALPSFYIRKNHMYFIINTDFGTASLWIIQWQENYGCRVQSVYGTPATNKHIDFHPNTSTGKVTTTYPYGTGSTYFTVLEL